MKDEEKNNRRRSRYGSCGDPGSLQYRHAGRKPRTQIESTAEGTSEDTAQGAGSQSTESAATSVSEISAEGITEIDIFVEEHNYNPVVYGPPEER